MILKLNLVYWLLPELVLSMQELDLYMLSQHYPYYIKLAWQVWQS